MAQIHLKGPGREEDSAHRPFGTHNSGQGLNSTDHRRESAYLHRKQKKYIYIAYQVSWPDRT